MLRVEKQNEISLIYIMKRWKTRCKDVYYTFFFYGCFVSFCIGQHSFPFMFYRELFFDEEVNLLDETPKDPMEMEMPKKISKSHNKFEDLI